MTEAQEARQAKPRKPAKRKKTQVEVRLESGALVIKTVNPDAPCGATWTFSDTGRAARADIVQKLMTAGRLRPMGDGLFGDDAQTWGLA